MASTLVLAVMQKAFFRVDELACERFLAEDGAAPRRAALAAPFSRMHVFVEKVRGRRARSREPVEGNVGEQLIAVYGVLRQFSRWSRPLFELLHDEGQLKRG